MLQGFVPKKSARYRDGVGEGKRVKPMQETNSSRSAGVRVIKIY